MNKDIDRHRALCESIALATRIEIGKDLDGLVVMLRALAADLERIRAEVSTLRKTLEAEQLQKLQEAERKAAKAAAKAAARAAAKAKQAKPAPPAGEGSEDAPAPPAAASSEDAPAPPAAAELPPSNAFLFFVRQVVDDVEGAREELLRAYPTPMRVRTLAAVAPKPGERAKLGELAEGWTGTGSELTPADWRALGRAAWKNLSEDQKNATRAAFKAGHGRQP